ncbi:MAG: glutamate racemase [Clostridiales bacterium GWD2_32_19]|nr:MAG: glutamate racemase [Clostridiales bacterium GWD2_32_19]
MNNKKVAVIDSGLGGLTVVKLLRERLPNENIIYFGDNARVPYGDKSKENIREFAKQIIGFLCKQDVKYIVIACNTMSSVALDVIKDTAQMPVADVIDPTIAYIKKAGFDKIGVIATSATIQSNIYERKVKEAATTIQVHSKACPLFVPIIEQGLLDGVIVEDAIERSLYQYKEIQPEAIVLGCTHYTVWEDNIEKYFNNKIKIINTSIPIVEYVIKDIMEKKIQNTSDTRGNMELYFSDSCERYKKYFENLFDDINIKIEENVDIK